MAVLIAHAFSRAGTTVRRRGTWAWATANLRRLALAPGYSDHTNASAPVTKGAATLVPPEGVALPSVPRLVMPSPGALRPRRPMEFPKLDSLSGLPRPSQAITAMTHGCRVMAVLPTVPWLPAAATTIAPRFAA